VAIATSTSKYLNSAEVEKQVRSYFKEVPAMVEIARCESKFRQYNDSGTVLRGGAGAGMVGVFQFYESIHAPAAKALGQDLTKLDGNLAYARHVYDTQGTTPWNSSRDCWQTTAYRTAAASTLTVTDEATRAKLLEQISTLTKLIAQLQKQLAHQRALLKS
jgi:hypothetical protein